MKCDWQRNCSYKQLGTQYDWGRRKVKNFDQWTEELSKQVFVQTDEENVKVLYKAKEVLVEDGFEEEE